MSLCVEPPDGVIVVVLGALLVELEKVTVTVSGPVSVGSDPPGEQAVAATQTATTRDPLVSFTLRW